MEKLPVHLVSYPKSGRTWLRVLLGTYYSLKYNVKGSSPVDITTITQNISHVPVVYPTHGNSSFLSYDENKKPKMALYPDNLHFDKGFENSKVIFLTREIEDVLVSYYHHMCNRVSRTYKYNGTLSQFIRDKRYGAEKICKFYKMWYDNLHRVYAYVHVSYEELTFSIQPTMSRLLTFLGENEIKESHLNKAIENSKFSKMQQMERNGQIGNRPQPSSDKNTLKVRNGKVGSYSTELSKDDSKYINNVKEKVGYASFKFK